MLRLQPVAAPFLRIAGRLGDLPMADLTPLIETMENRWMRAWVMRDVKAMKALTSGNFIYLAGSTRPALLDRPSWLEAVAKRWSCASYRFGEVYVRDLGGGFATFSAPLELKAAMDGKDWSGQYWVTDLWRKGRVRRQWKLVQRILSRPDEIPGIAPAIRSLQLWR